MVQWLGLCSQCRGPGFDLWSENQIPHAATKTWDSQISIFEKRSKAESQFSRPTNTSPPGNLTSPTLSGPPLVFPGPTQSSPPRLATPYPGVPLLDLFG